MGKRRFAERQRGGSRRKGHEDVYKNGSKKTVYRSRDEVADSPSPGDSGDSDVEHTDIVSDGESEEMVEIQKENTMYDNLLKTLGSASESLARANKRRQREEEGRSDSEEEGRSDSEEEGRSGSEEDINAGSESRSMSGEDTDASDDDSPQMDSGGSKHQGLVSADVIEQADTDDTYADNAFDSDDECDFNVNGNSIAKAPASTSSFDEHVRYKLSKDEVSDLMREKWKTKWKVPAVGMPKCKWIGNGERFVENDDINLAYDLKPRLYDHWLDNYKANGGKDFHSSRQRSFFSLCNSYRDILHHNKKPFYLKGVEEDSSITDAYIMHSLNHIFKSGDLVAKNDAKVAKLQETTKNEILSSEEFLDRGFTRPKILILLPFASIAYRLVKRLIQLTPSKHKVNVENNDRFLDEYGTATDEIDETENSKSQKSSKPSDFQALFGGNNNDHFMIGIKFTRRSMKLYNDFYSSDMIVASPLGLITKIGEAEINKEKDTDYLSSIEVLVIDHADVIAMQNWSHVSTVFEKLNRIPSKQHGTDIMRIRPWYLDGQAKFYRQSIILGSHLNPDINAVFNRNCHNYRGKVKLDYDHKGVLPKVLLQVRQIYQRFDAESIVDVDDARLAYFSQKVFPKIKDSIQGGTMIFISSYFEFVRLRNFLKSQDASFCLLGEYTKQSDISRARVWFFQERRKIMLYTERAHFYHRYKIRGIQNLIIYSLPERKEFYPEIVNMLQGSENMTTTVLFSCFDMLRLERIVGRGPAKRMATSDKDVFIFT
ncbi:protein NUCLEOLAR FACTOR 1 isoform X1 [Daucus carota subsp. sativus]|uniref:protein NUCLEOLAR FACTOR 1 isoform X1 n=2 Tax=Daucus carota subsp. sativus TaxID=79200 RepID=UPI0007EFABBD|nr:PREDICTED: U3 small nucleolar RNA-associated protein 25 isoform X1 [Daucus carota subsp. sativus]